MTWILSAFADEAGDSIEAQVSGLAESGLHWIDLRNVNGYNITELPVDEAERVAGRLEKAGIGVCMFGAPIGKIDIADDFEPELDRLAHLGQMKKIFGCERVRIFSYFNRQGAPEEAWRQEALDRLRRLAEKAGALGLRLMHENEKEIFGDRLPRVRALAEALRDPETFGFIFDFDNYNQCGDDVWENWQALAGQTDAFHLKDSDERNQHVPIGQGNGQAPRILRAAAEAGWAGPLTLEPHLVHSAAVMATGPSGQANESYQHLGPRGCFKLAAAEAQQLLEDVGAGWR